MGLGFEAYVSEWGGGFRLRVEGFGCRDGFNGESLSLG